MKLYFKHLHALSLFIGINIFFIPSPALAVNEYTTTKVIVTEGKVICFDLGNYIRCGVGYNFTDYDDDLRHDDNWDAKGLCQIIVDNCTII